MSREAQRLGAWGEALVARKLGYRRNPGSGSRWPRKQDLWSREGKRRRVAQVKTTRDTRLLREWRALQSWAEVERAEPHLYIVVVEPRQATVFEMHPVLEVALGVGGDE